MAVPVDLVREDFVGDGAQTAFPTGILVTASAQVKLYDIDESVSPATSTLIAKDVDYTETLLDPLNLPTPVTVDVSLLYPTGYPTDHRLAVVRDTVLVQDEDFTPTDRFPASVIELILDTVVLQTQVAKWLAERSIRAPIGDTDASVGLELPIATLRAGKFIIFDALGNVTVTDNGIATGTVPVSAFGALLVLSADAAAAQALLEVGQDQLAYQVYTF